MKNAPIRTTDQGAVTGLNSNILTARKLFNSLRSYELMRVEASGHTAMLMPAMGEAGRFHTTHITPDKRVFVSTEPLKAAQIAVTFERTGFPINVPYVSVERELQEGFAGFENNPYEMSAEAREELFGKPNRSREAAHALN